jgi:hypothetical protein
VAGLLTAADGLPAVARRTLHAAAAMAGTGVAGCGGLSAGERSHDREDRDDSARPILLARRRF